MAIINYSPWQDAANYGQGLGSSLTNLLIALPQLRQQQMLNQAHVDLYRQQIAESQANVTNQGSLTGAHVGLYNAQAGSEKSQAGYYDAKKGEVSSSEATKLKLGEAFKNYAEATLNGGDVKPHVGAIVENYAKLPATDRHHLGEQLAQVLEMSNPRYRQALGLGSQMTIPVGPGATAFSNVTGQPEFQSPRQLGYGDRLVPGAGGDPIAQGVDRPFAAQNFGAVFGAGYKPVTDEGMSPTNAAQNVINYLQNIKRGLGMGMPTEAPGRARRYNPDTDDLE